ncbi:tail terminator [Microbacterium phage CaptainRex]|nr:tail terminator [Microbacterium phage QuadZero]UVK59171.1 tail terminator [Microbacterium phage Librie]WIC89844.1 tail terminator [Microbacterium phage CaptainRex]
MSIWDDIHALVTGPKFKGYPATGARAPFVVSRPLLTQDEVDRALSGDPLAWDVQFSLYCAGASVEASYNVALGAMRDLDGKPVGGTTLSTSLGYIGAQVEGHYETQVTVKLNQGGI